MSNKNNLTPLMKQYYDIKSKNPENLLLFQVGDFYELFFEDAIKVSSSLGLTLTKRGTDINGNPIPLCGIPVHVLDHYLVKLVKNGFKVAICNQLEAPQVGKIVKRGITQILTPGTLTDSKLLDEKSASYLSVFFPTSDNIVLFFAELLTGQLFITYFNSKEVNLVESEILRFMPDEIIVPDSKESKKYILKLKEISNITIESCNSEKDQESQNWFKERFYDINNNLFNIDAFNSALSLFYKYLENNNFLALKEIKNISIYQPNDFLMLDSITQKNLDLIKNSQDNSYKNSLFSVLDQACSSMGSRLIKKWVSKPLIKRDLIEKRLESIEFFLKNLDIKDKIRSYISKISDLERVVGRISLSRANLNDYILLMQTLEIVPFIKKELKNINSELLSLIESKILDFSNLYNLLINSINSDITNSSLIKRGFNSEIDRLRDLIENGTQEILNLEKREQKRTGINSLKIRYNGVYGYSIEITKANLDLVPQDYIRSQTLSNKERFTNQELKDLEYDINRANNNILDLEKDVFENIKSQVSEYLPDLKKLSYSLSYLDGILSLAQVAYNNNYIRPKFNNKRKLIIEDGRHPVVEISLREKFIPNSTNLDDKESLWIITGPNMGGKSTYLRQTALICIMAQIGSFVPAKNADLFILDRIFTRIGAGDNLYQGKSTFLQEMEETALICNQATENSLLILDEVGRGTGTLDGLSIAQSVIEYIYNNLGSRCLFATHYFELTELNKKFENIALYHAASSQSFNNIILMHKILKGVSQSSFGLEVAKIAQMPEKVIKRAQEIFNSFKDKDN